MTDTDLNTLFKQAVDEYGQKYLDAEKALIAADATGKEFLQTQLADSKQTDFARFIAQTLIDAMDGTMKPYTDAMSAIGESIKRTRRTPLGTPKPDTVAGKLGAYSPKLSDLVVLHLIKELNWPMWLQTAAIIYLGYYADGSVLTAFDKLKEDIEKGLHGPKTATLEDASGTYFNQLEEAMEMVRITIKSDTPTS